MVSQTVDYALRAVVCLARRPGVPQAAGQIAEVTGVPANYLPKVLQPLVRRGVLAAVRGVHGGYRLRCDPEELRVLDVVNSVDPITRIDRCPNCLPEYQQWLCPLHRLLDQAAEGTQQTFASVTIAALLRAADAVPTARPA